MIAQLIMGVLTGGWGLVLATPLMLIGMVLVKETYIKAQDKRNCIPDFRIQHGIIISEMVQQPLPK